jgi:hypothetical protein
MQTFTQTVGSFIVELTVDIKCELLHIVVNQKPSWHRYSRSNISLAKYPEELIQYIETAFSLENLIGVIEEDENLCFELYNQHGDVKFYCELKQDDDSSDSDRLKKRVEHAESYAATVKRQLDELIQQQTNHYTNQVYKLQTENTTLLTKMKHELGEMLTKINFYGRNMYQLQFEKHYEMYSASKEVIGDIIPNRCTLTIESTNSVRHILHIADEYYVAGHAKKPGVCCYRLIKEKDVVMKNRALDDSPFSQRDVFEVRIINEDKILVLEDSAMTVVTIKGVACNTIPLKFVNKTGHQALLCFGRFAMVATHAPCLEIWDTNTLGGAVIQRFNHSKNVHCLSALDKRHFVTGCNDGSIGFYDIDQGEINRFEAHNLNTVVSLAAMDQYHVFSSCRSHSDHTLRLWDLRDTKNHTIVGKCPAVSELCFLGGPHVAAACLDNKVRIFDIRMNNSALKEISVSHRANSLAISNDQRIVCGLDNGNIIALGY